MACSCTTFLLRGDRGSWVSFILEVLLDAIESMVSGRPDGGEEVDIGPSPECLFGDTKSGFGFFGGDELMHDMYEMYVYLFKVFFNFQIKINGRKL